ncbi:hypothetical protein ABB37_08140 [Leptomonas pyrrhocoris]|uniref:Uncharacterized protein n=1 Tax=Leptomonas pyrrhocoris TaxID=157538 RepID=A0A0N0DSE9_LEPPY|nr:hypothetical protein ABB37_08140 [Leptomonas pyrrhocoris]KPA75988.1 hypothetical protein ABB37_08140 [Leptomonas pyrrhocoris]|eukprot:XP_015654427.1 hypothetical protein ABB37_08140 [Leptomonas pyrrhocoris]
MSASAPAAADAATPNGLADTRMFLRPPPYSLRGEERLYASANSWNAGVLLAGSPLAGSSTAASSTLYRSARVMMDRPDGAERAGAGAASAERQRELQQQLQRALARQRRLERLMFHDGDDNAVGEAADEEESTEGFNDEDDDVDVEPLWQSSPLTQVLLPGTIATAAAQPSSSLPQQPSQEDPPPYRVSSVHPHVHVSLSRFREAREDEGDLGIRADSVLDVPREWRVVGRVRNTTTSPSPQPDPSWVRRQRRQQRRGGGRGPHQPSRHQPSGSAATTAEGSPAPTPASTTSTRAAAAAAAATAREASMTAAHRHTASTSNSAATVSRSAAMAPTSSQRGGSGTSEADTDAARMPTATSTSPITTAMSPSMLSVMTAALRGPSSMSLFAPSLPRHTERAQEAEGRTRPAAVAEGDADTAAAHDASVSPVLPSPIRAVAVRRPSMPSAALTDIVWDMTVWKGDSAAVADPAAATAVVLHCPRLASAAASSFSSSASSSSPSWRRSSPQVNGAGRCAGGRRVVRAVDDDDDDDDPHVGVKEASACRQSSPAPAQLPNEAAVPRRRRPAPRWAEAQGSEERKRDADGEEVADSVSLPASGDFDSPSPAARCGSGQGSAPSSGAFRALDEAADSEVPTVRRTSPGVSEPSSKCTRSSAGEDGGSSGSAQAAGSAAGTGGGGEDRESTSEHSASLRRASSASASPAPQHRSTDDDAILFHATSVGKEAVDTPQVTAPRSTAAAAAAAPMLFLSDMLRLSFSPGRDDGNDGDDNAAGESNDVDGASSSPVSGTAPGRRYNSMSAATPRSAGPPASRYFSRVESHPCDTTCEGDPVSGGGTERYPPPPPPPPRASDDGERTVTRGERSGVATTSISSSPPSPNRTAIRHAASLMTEEEEDGYAEGGPPHSSLMSARSPFYPSSPSNSAAAAASHLFPALSITPRTPTGVSNRLALSMDERGLYASTASTVAWDTMASLSVLSTTPPPAAAGDRPSFAQPRFSEDSLASCTTRSPAAAVFSTPAETRLMSLLRASTWAASTHQDDDAASEQRVEEEEEEMCTPRRCADLENVSHSSAFSSPAPPLRTSDSSPFPNGTREADGAAAAGASTAMMPPPPSFSPSLFTAMAPPQSSPFRGSGSFLHVPPSWSACHNITTNAVEEGRPSDGFEADIQLLARMTRMTVGGNGAAATAAAAPPIPSTPPKHNAEEQQQQQQRRVPSPSSSPVRFSTNSLSFFITAAGGVAAVTGGGRSPAGARRDDDDDRCRMRSGSGVYGSAVASRRSWAPRKARPGRRGKQPRTRASVSGGGGDSGRYVSSFASAAASYSRNPYHQLRFTSELTSPSPSARPSGGDGSSRNSVSGVVLLPQRLTFGSAIPSLSSQLASTVITSEGVSDSGERCSTALSTPTGNVFPTPQQQQRQESHARLHRPIPMLFTPNSAAMLLSAFI